MSDFLNFVHREEKARAKTEEEKLALHKKQKLREAQKYEDDDDFYDEEINEAVRVPRKPIPKQVVRKETPVEEQDYKYCVPKPTKSDIAETEAEIKQYGVRPIKRRQLDFDPGFNESRATSIKNTVVSQSSVKQNPVLIEAYKMMDDMKKKIEDMFYQYGMSGLEKLNESMLDVFEEILNPPVREPEPRIVERVVEVPVQPTPKPVTRKRTVKKKAAPIKERTNVKDVETCEDVAENVNILEEEKGITKSQEISNFKKQKQMFEDISNTADLSELGEYLTEQDLTQKTTQSEADIKYSQLMARIEKLRQTMDETNKQQIEEKSENEEPYEQPEEFDIVDDTDSTDIDLEQLETENNEEN